MSVRSEALVRTSDRAHEGLSHRIVRSRAEIEPVWQRLEAGLRSTGLANSWTWTKCWLDAYGATTPHWFVVAEHAGQVVGVALMTRGVRHRRGPLPIRSVHVGTAGEERGCGIWVEYNRVLVAPQHRTAFLALLLGTPGVRPLAADVLEFNGFDPDELPRAIQDQIRIREEPCYVTDLTRSATVLEAFDGDTRRKLRKNSKRFAESFGALATEWVETAGRGQEVLRELIEHHQARWTSAGKPGAFADQRFRQFHRDLVARLLPAGRVVLVRITAGETLVGIFYGFVEQGVLYHYQWGLPAFEDNSLSPGFVTGFLVMEEAKRRGMTELNWLAGDSRYKRDLSNSTRSLIWAEKSLSPWHRAINLLIALYGVLPDSQKRMIRGLR
jgi:CelD/BcsL family acetyltransferase involved in cellulose biosynthesis